MFAENISRDVGGQLGVGEGVWIGSVQAVDVGDEPSQLLGGVDVVYVKGVRIAGIVGILHLIVCPSLTEVKRGSVVVVEDVASSRIVKEVVVEIGFLDLAFERTGGDGCQVFVGSFGIENIFIDADSGIRIQAVELVDGDRSGQRW